MTSIIASLLLVINPLVAQENTTSKTYELDAYEYCTIVNPTLAECIKFVELTDKEEPLK